jgi:predicted nucleic acid-binding protein
MIAYLDSSIVLRYLLAGDETIKHALAFPSAVSSELLDIECRRVFFRCRMAGELDDSGYMEALSRFDALSDGLDLVELSRPVRKRAREAFPLAVRTLDALHLSTALLLAAENEEASVQVFSHDRAMNLCAKALGMGAPLM